MRGCRILQLLILTVSSTLPLAADPLSGEHVCTRVENYTLTVRETYTEPVIVQTFTWCLQVPPRCSKSRVENRERYRIHNTVKERRIFECCDGYVLREELHDDAEGKSKCVPICESCKNGKCLRPNICQCESGYQGDDCARECPSGSWGEGCMKKCSCDLGRPCNPVTGICECPSGWRGAACKLPCDTGRWGFGCKSICECGDERTGCDPETGNCHVEENSNVEDGLSSNWTKGDVFRTFQVSGLVASTPPTTTTTTTVPWQNANKDTETTVSKTDDDPPAPELKDFSVTRFSQTTEQAEDESRQAISETRDEIDVFEPVFPLSNSAVESESTTTIISDKLTQFDEIFSETRTETKITMAPKLSEKNFYRNGDDEGENRVRTAGPPHPSYVKTVQKDHVPQIPYDTTVLIVVGSVVSLCITTLAALMVFYLRSRVLESIPLSIYGNDKNDGGQEKGNTIRSFNITNTTLPPLPTFVNPVFAANPENALITFDAAELNKHYDNRTGTISIRVSRNMRDLLEGHYDRPPAATCRHTVVEQNAEHLYDEIPLTVPLCVRKET